MAWTVATFQDQVQMMTGNTGLNDRVLTWVNRVLMEIAKKAYWTKQTKSITTPTVIAGTPTTLAGAWLENTDDLGEQNIVSLHRVEVTNSNSETLLTHCATRDLYALYNGRLVSYKETNDITHYAVPTWATGSSGATQHLYPNIAVYPGGANGTTTTKVYFLTVPDKLTGADGSHWFMNKYPTMVLAGLLRYVFLYLGDAQSYLVQKAIYVNGIKDAILSEESVVASTPSMRSVFPEILARGSQ